MFPDVHPEVALIRFILTLRCNSMKEKHHDSDLEIFAVFIFEYFQFVVLDIVEHLLNFGVRNAIPCLVESDHVVEPCDLVAKL